MNEKTNLDAMCAQFCLEGHDEKRPIIAEINRLHDEKRRLNASEIETQNLLRQQIHECDLKKISLKAEMQSKQIEYNERRRTINEAVAALDAKCREINQKVSAKCDEARRQFLEWVSTPPPQPLYFGVITL